eukprot:TRINITY_DN35874_c0_g1_i4.p1 TRINITY_DN35874_c0_g1~~TRINITY_DN35874_c0_g1_i4.p1  ORF type:complete len:851 (-),score=143.18 TRINITY_DN35874_c0_g1_i4:51-2543(-)
MAADTWNAAFQAIRRESDFNLLSQLIKEGCKTGIDDASIDWDGVFLTPLFSAVLLSLDDQLSQLIALGADPSTQCFFEGLLCCPLHAAALRCDAGTLTALLDAECDVNVLAEASAVEEDAASVASNLVSCNALHVLVSRDVFSDEVYRLLLRRGARLSVPCKDRTGNDVSGLLLPRLLENKTATEGALDTVLGEEVMHMISSTRLAHSLNSFLDLGDHLRRDFQASYRFASNVDFQLAPAPSDPLPVGLEEAPSTALLYAAEVGNCEAVRLLLYAGADASKTMKKVLPFDQGRSISLPLQAVQLAVLRSDLVLVEQLLFFGLEPNITCTGHVHHTYVKRELDILGRPKCATPQDVSEEQWVDLSLFHLAVLKHDPEVIPALHKLECDIDGAASRSVEGGPFRKVSPLYLAVLLEDARCCAKLLDSGATISQSCCDDALKSTVVCELFGGASPVGLEQWVATLLTGEDALQELLERRTDLSRSYNWPEEHGATARLMDGYTLAEEVLVRRLSKAVEEVPTTLRGLKPIHLACMLEQPWALRMLVEAGAKADGKPPCQEVIRNEAVTFENPALNGLDMDLMLLCARMGAIDMMEALSRDTSHSWIDVHTEVALTPDITPAMYPRPDDFPGVKDQPVWAWLRLGPLELALLHRRTDVLIMLSRLGADLLHRVDHVAINPPNHYSITDACFRGLTPLHLCAFLDMKASAAAILAEASRDSHAPPLPEDKKPPMRKELLGATCTQAFATVESSSDIENEPWLWKDLTPLHVALLAKSWDTADLLIEASTRETLELPCISRDLELDTERCSSALLIAFDLNRKDLHRKIAKKFPTC